MIRLDRESPVICATCGQPAIRREVDTRHATGGRTVVYETHANSISDEEHHAALGRIDIFHERVHALQFSLQGRYQLSKGWMDHIEVGTVTPSACDVRTLITPNAEVHAFGLTGEAILEARPLEGADKESILADLIAAGEVTAEKLKQRVEQGNF